MLASAAAAMTPEQIRDALLDRLPDHPDLMRPTAVE